MNSTRIANFVRRYVRHPLYILTYVVLYLIPGFRIRIQIYTEEETRAVLQEGKSLIRFGDGEINLLLGLRNHYHEYSPRLRSLLLDIVRGYGSDSPYILAVPQAITVPNRALRKIQRFNVWLPFKTMFILLFPRRMPYVDAHCFYYDGYAERVLGAAFRDAAIVLITNAATIEKQRTNPRIPWKDIRYVTIPEANLLGAYASTLKAIDAVCSEFTGTARPVLLFAAGPAGKFLIKEYSSLGYQCIDIGRGAEAMFTSESIEELI